ncbi:Tim17-domain-containing protein [Microthyrium microscopicum]|uniref:Mitochondrial import inner membrane translocase subunit TIM22 n=1 Tax=Microthyrium microscopicum TaxID=703497 RepID=A0A6A6UQU7_9PEZI|nr:Tim17-domain-containing protein [Microthyrium microscopicum]
MACLRKKCSKSCWSAPRPPDSQFILTRLQMKSVMESCPAKSVMATVMGGALGGMFGLFMSSMRYDTPLAANPNLPGGKALVDLPMREQLRHGLRDMGKASLSSAKNFAYLGGVFSGVECCIESLRGKNDIWNGVMGGGLTGGILARKQGPGAMLFGAAGFAAFSYGIEWYMRSPDNERRYPVE